MYEPLHQYVCQVRFRYYQPYSILYETHCRNLIGIEPPWLSLLSSYSQWILGSDDILERLPYTLQNPVCLIKSALESVLPISLTF